MQAAPTSGFVSEASANSVAGPDGLVTAALAHARVALRQEASGVHDHRRGRRNQAVGDPAVDRCERLLHTSHRNGCDSFRNIHEHATLRTSIPLIQ